jgi:hypothetical protein|tara:strand:- start:134 stop:373 length:240 start_codon:yes stop_codon:yes gene_type:complete
MKKVNFDLEVEVHSELKEEDLKKCLLNHLINQESFSQVVLKVIGESHSPNNFDINLRKFDLKTKEKPKSKPKAKSKAKK